MPQPAIQVVSLAQQYALPATTPANSVTLPVRPGWRPYTEATRGKRPVYLKHNRNLAAATAPGTAAPIGIFGCDLTYDSASFGVNNAGQALPGADPLNSALNLAQGSVAGCYVDTIRVSGGAGTGLGPIVVLNPGSGYNPASAPAVTFTGLGTAAGTALISPDGRLVGVTLTNIGTFSASGTVTVAAPTNGVTATVAFSAGQVTTVNTRIPFATHAPTTAGGAFWLAMWRDRVIACNTGLIAAISGANGLDPDQQVVGLSSAGSYTNAGFTVASATHPDGTLTIGQLTLGLGIPNGSFITVYRGLVRQLLAPAATNGLLNLQIKALDCMWLGGNATAGATETSVVSSMLAAVNN
jgi:hypothetical protein